MMNNPYASGSGWSAPTYPYTTTASPGAGMTGAGMTGAGMSYPPSMPSGGMGYPPSVPSGGFIPGGYPPGNQTPTPSGLLPLESSYIENILRLNLGKVATIYMTFENNSEWNAKIFKGVLEAAGRDHIIISDPQTGVRYLLLMVNLDYITFNEELNYTYPFS